MIYLVIYAAFCIWFAKVNSNWIKKGKRVRHGFNGLIHVSAAILVTFLERWELGLSILVVARLVFDTALNFWRKLPIGYVPTKPKSIVDRVEKWIFKNDGYTPKAIYILLLAILITVKF